MQNLTTPFVPAAPVALLTVVALLGCAEDLKKGFAKTWNALTWASAWKDLIATLTQDYALCKRKQKGNCVMMLIRPRIFPFALKASA
mmetsp:Transcript_74666/g.120535  ORF Transcript_74666/g.120535 Transcript_74666/m.120535 type:complete len:87 (+) Transcript_74666:1531-1791(+)